MLTETLTIELFILAKLNNFPLLFVHISYWTRKEKAYDGKKREPRTPNKDVSISND